VSVRAAEFPAVCEAVLEPSAGVSAIVVFL
jgi:hypothetical protein